MILFKNKTMENKSEIQKLKEEVERLKENQKTERSIRLGYSREIGDNVIRVDARHHLDINLVVPDLIINNNTYYFNDLNNLSDLSEYIQLRIREIEMEATARTKDK